MPIAASAAAGGVLLVPAAWDGADVRPTHKPDWLPLPLARHAPVSGALAGRTSFRRPYRAGGRGDARPPDCRIRGRPGRVRRGAGISPNDFSALVKQRTGYSPMQDFNKLRINRAKLLLRATR